MIEPNPIDLNAEIIKHPASTFYARVNGESMKDANILNGDLLVIDKSLEPKSGDIALCYVADGFTLKYIELHEDYILLIPANEAYETIRVSHEDQYSDSYTIWGIVTHVIHKTSR